MAHHTDNNRVLSSSSMSIQGGVQICFSVRFSDSFCCTDFHFKKDGPIWRWRTIGPCNDAGGFYHVTSVRKSLR